MMSNLAIYQEFENLQRAALALQKSGYFQDAKTEAQAIVKVMAGAELGLPPFASMTGIHIIKGKPVMGANVQATLVKNDPRYDYRVVVCDNKECLIDWYENGAKVGESSFTISEAQSAGLVSKDNWKKYPSDMLFARAISRGAKRHAPGVFGGAPVYTPDEMGLEIDPDGEIIDVEPIEAPANPVISEPVAVPANVQFALDEMGSDGIRYGQKDTDTLSHMHRSICNQMKNNGLDDEKLAEYSRKKEAIETIMQYREENNIE